MLIGDDGINIFGQAFEHLKLRLKSRELIFGDSHETYSGKNFPGIQNSRTQTGIFFFFHGKRFQHPA